MKNKVVLIIMLAILYACSGSSDDPAPTPPDSKNNTPSIPTLIFPTNNLLCTNNTIKFEWNKSTDSDGDSITYSIQIASDSDFLKIIDTQNLSGISYEITLEKGKLFYWRVNAKDSKSNTSSYSSIFSFFTESNQIGNHLPLTPELTEPIVGAVVNSGMVKLEWSSVDEDNDPIVFDLFFGTENPPINKVIEDSSETSIDVSTEPNSQYFWYVIAKDNISGKSIGQTWSFSTK